MATLSDLGIVTTFSDRINAINDTGRTAYCGPYVVSAITGLPISLIEAEIAAARPVEQADRGEVKGTTTEEIGRVLTAHGFAMGLRTSYMHLARKERPSLWMWMQRPRPVFSHFILAVHKGKEGHWIVVKGVKFSDTYSEGRWQFVCDGPHKGAKVMEVFEVKRAIDGAS